MQHITTPVPFCGSAASVFQDRHLLTEQWDDQLRASQTAVARIVRVDEDRHTGWQQFRAGGGDGQIRIVASSWQAIQAEVEAQGDKFTLALQIIQVGLGQSCLAFRAPDGGRLAAVGQPFADQVDERPLRDAPGALIDGAVGIAPVDRQPQALPELLVFLFRFFAELQAFFDERAAARSAWR